MTQPYRSETAQAAGIYPSVACDDGGRLRLLGCVDVERVAQRRGYRSAETMCSQLPADVDGADCRRPLTMYSVHGTSSLKEKRK